MACCVCGVRGVCTAIIVLSMICAFTGLLQCLAQFSIAAGSNAAYLNLLRLTRLLPVVTLCCIGHMLRKFRARVLHPRLTLGLFYFVLVAEITSWIFVILARDRLAGPLEVVAGVLDLIFFIFSVYMIANCCRIRSRVKMEDSLAERYTFLGSVPQDPSVQTSRIWMATHTMVVPAESDETSERTTTQKDCDTEHGP